MEKGIVYNIYTKPLTCYNMAKAKTAAESRKVEISKKTLFRHTKTKQSFAKQSKNYIKRYRGQGR